MFDSSSESLTGIKLVYVNFEAKKFVWIRYLDKKTQVAQNLAYFKEEFETVACSDNFSGVLICGLLKRSGELCVLKIESGEEGQAKQAISCKIAKYHDLEINHLMAIDDLILVGGGLVSTNNRLALIYQIKPNLDYPVFASGSLDLSYLTPNLSTSQIFASDLSIFGKRSTIIAVEKDQILFFALTKVKLVVPASMPYEVKDDNVGFARIQIEAHSTQRSLQRLETF